MNTHDPALETLRQIALQAVAHSQPDAAASDPRVLGWMAGHPPPADKRISLEGRGFPQIRWSFSHIRELIPTRAVRRGPGPVTGLPRDEVTLDDLTFVDGTGATRRFDESLALTYTDGIVVLHRGRIVFERYFGALDEFTPHLAMSVTKSFIGTLAALLTHERALDPSRAVSHYVPELANSGWADATVRQVMDMRTGLDYSEVYADPKSSIWDYARACGSVSKPPDYAGPRAVADFLQTVRPLGGQGGDFAYKTVNTEVLAWVMRRITGGSIAALMSERLWQKLGVEADAYFGVDEAGQETCGGGLNTTLRDLARFGEMLRNRGEFGGRSVLPEAVVATIEAGGDPARFAPAGYALLSGWSYANQWWVSHQPGGMYEARGIHGQRLHVHPGAQLVVARYASHPIAANAGNDPYTHSAYAALARRLNG